MSNEKEDVLKARVTQESAPNTKVCSGESSVTEPNAVTKNVLTEYNFTDVELKALVLLFSKIPVPRGLEKLYHFATNYSYKTMTIDEAEKLLASSEGF